MSADAGALVMYVPPPPPVVNANLSVLGCGDLVSNVPRPIQVETRRREAPEWIHKVLLPRLKLRADLTVTFIDEKAVTKSDLGAQQNRFRLRTDGVLRRLLPVLTDDDIVSANLLHDQPRIRRASPTTSPESDDCAAVDGEQGRRRSKKLGRKHGGLPVRVVASHHSIKIKQLELLRWDGSQGTVIKGGGYHDFIHACGFKENDLVELWVFKQRKFRNFGVNMCDESLLFIVLDNRHAEQRQPVVSLSPRSIMTA